VDIIVKHFGRQQGGGPAEGRVEEGEIGQVPFFPLRQEGSPLRRWPPSFPNNPAIPRDGHGYVCLHETAKETMAREGIREIPGRLSVLPAGWRWDGTSLLIRLSGVNNIAARSSRLAGRPPARFMGVNIRYPHPPEERAFEKRVQRVSHPVGPLLSAGSGSGAGFGVCFGSVPLLSSL